MRIFLFPLSRNLSLKIVSANPRKGKITRKEKEKIVENGIRSFDTAQVYQNGGSEERYGKFLTPKYREHVLILTKTMAEDAATARRHLEASLRRMKTDYLDLWAWGCWP